VETDELRPGEGFRDEEFPDGGDEGDETLPCPKCGKSIYAEAPRCPHCGDYVAPGSAVRQGWPRWMWVCLVLAGLVLLSWALRI
jgi:hypothetical protein